MAREAVKTADQDQAEHDVPAAQPQPTTGPGVQALQALLAHGRPDPDKVVRIIDTYRGERDALLALLHKTLGNAYVQQVMSAMHGLRADIKRQEVAAGDPSDPTADSFVASKDGAKWRAGDGAFTGEVTKDALHSTNQIGSNDTIKADADFKKQQGTVDWVHDGKTQAELYGDFKNHEYGLRRNWDLGEGAQITGGLRHQEVAGPGSKTAVASDQAFATYTKGTTKIDGGVGMSGGELAGSASVAADLGKRDRVEASYRHDAAGDALTAKETHTFGSGAKLVTDGWLRDDDKATTGKLSTAYSDKDTKLDASVARSADATSWHLGGSQQLDDRWTLSGNADYVDKDKGADAFTGKIAANYKSADGKRTFDTSVSRAADSTTLHAGGKDQLTPALGLTGSLDYLARDNGTGQATGKLGGTYRTPNLTGDVNLEAGVGTRDYANINGQVTGGIAPNLYATGFGSAGYESGKQLTGYAGAGLTFTPTDKTALTLAGVIDNNGHLETRLEFDVFKSRVENAAGLSAAQKQSLVSLFVSYAPHGTVGNVMNDRYAAPTMSHGFDTGNTVTAGIRIKF